MGLLHNWHDSLFLNFKGYSVYSQGLQDALATQRLDDRITRHDAFAEHHDSSTVDQRVQFFCRWLAPINAVKCFCRPDGTEV